MPGGQSPHRVFALVRCRVFPSLAGLIVALAWGGEAMAQDVVPECDPISPAVGEEIVFDCNPMSLAGTFSDRRGSYEERPAYLGTEIRIVTTEEGFDASVQFGGSRLLVADVAFEFEGWPLGVPLPSREPDTECVTLTMPEGAHAGVFVGTLSRDLLAGEFFFDTGERLEVSLPRVPEWSD